jgi:very-short-patch-repair endonuclease
LGNLAKRLRKGQTDAESLLWSFLRNRQLDGFKFRRQHPIPPYIVDFACVDIKLVVEIDGGQHADQRSADAKRTAFLESLGFRVVRFWNNEVLSNTDSVLEQILFASRNRPPSPPASGGRGPG